MNHFMLKLFDKLKKVNLKKNKVTNIVLLLLISITVGFLIILFIDKKESSENIEIQKYQRQYTKNKGLNKQEVDSFKEKSRKKQLIEVYESKAKICLKQKDTLNLIQNLKSALAISISEKNNEKTKDIIQLLLNYLPENDQDFINIHQTLISSYDKIKNTHEREQQYWQQLEELKKEEKKINQEKTITYIVKITLILLLITSIIISFKSIIIKKQSKLLNSQRKKQEKINKRINKLNFQLTIKNEQIEQYSRQVTSHIKSSIDRLGSNSKKMIEKITDKQNEDIFIYQINEESQKLHDLIEFLLLNTTNSIEKKQKPTEIDFENIIKQVQMSLKNSIDLIEPIIILPKTFPKFIGYSIQMYQILKNLFENSLKYSSSERTTIIDLKISKEKNILHITFEDNGIGIPFENQKNIFKKFEQSRNEDAKKGYGIGLYICSEIIKNYNGTIIVDSKSNQGTKFIIQMSDIL